MSLIFKTLNAGEQPIDQGSRLSEAMTDIVDQDGRVVNVGLAEARALGLEAKTLIGAPLSMIYSAESIQIIDRVFFELSDSQVRVIPKLQLISGDGELLEVCAFARLERDPAGGGRILHLEKTDLLLSEPELGSLRRQNEILKGFFSSSQDACWCIEYLEPPDLEAPDNEVVRQLFENSSRWAACNPAMEKMYGLPEGQAFSEQGIKGYFPRNAENEKFANILIESGFSITGARAMDLRHDGSVMHVENDVEALICDGKLYRMWGTVRDISARIESGKEINEQWTVMSNILDVLPCPIMVADNSLLIEAVNPALEALLQLPAESLLNQHIAILFSDTAEIEKAWQEFERGGKKVKIDASIRDGKGGSIKAPVFIDILEGSEGQTRYALTLGCSPLKYPSV